MNFQVDSLNCGKSGWNKYLLKFFLFAILLVFSSLIKFLTNCTHFPNELSEQFQIQNIRLKDDMFYANGLDYQMLNASSGVSNALPSNRFISRTSNFYDLHSCSQLLILLALPALRVL